MDNIVDWRRSDVRDFHLLPPDVIERILCKIPFPELLKIRSLSKAWYCKFPLRVLKDVGVAGGTLYLIHNKDRDHNGSRSFQNIVSSVSHMWSVYSPVILGDEGLTAYEPEEKRWQVLCADFQEFLCTDMKPGLSSSCGPLICGACQSPNNQHQVVIFNVLTGSWRLLPPHPNPKVPSFLNLFFDTSSGYKVFLITEEPYGGPHEDLDISNFNGSSTRRCVSAQVFDSVEGRWTMSQSEFPFATSFAWRSSSVHFDKNIYCLSGDDRNPIEHPFQVWKYSLLEGMWTEIIHPFGRIVVNAQSGLTVLGHLTHFKLVVCEAQILLVLALDPMEPYNDWAGENTLLIYELDPESLIITEKSRGPPTNVLANCEHVAINGAIIYFCPLDLPACSPVVAYDVKLEKWSRLTLDFRSAERLTNKQWAEFSLEPGLNPFVAP